MMSVAAKLFQAVQELRDNKIQRNQFKIFFLRNIYLYFRRTFYFFICKKKCDDIPMLCHKCTDFLKT